MSVPTVTFRMASCRLEDATVTLGWDDGQKSGTQTCTCDGSGQCSVSKTNRSKRDHVTFTVSNVEHGTLLWDPSANTDPDGDSGGFLQRPSPLSVREG